MPADWPVFLGFTLMIFGGAAWLTGGAVASTWRSPWQVVGYSLLLGLFDRFLAWGMFGSALFSPGGFIRDFSLILAIGLFSWRIRHVGRIVAQYPWLYVRRGPLSYRSRD